MKKNIAILLAALTLGLISCEPELDLVRHFVIEEGEHYASPRVVETLQSNTLTFSAVFDESCKYIFDDAGFQDSKNKLLGFSDCNSTHHENSARFAWQWFHDRLEIFAYCYVNGERVEEFIAVVEPGETNHYEIELLDHAYVFKVNNQEPVRIKRGSTCNTGVYYMLWPYFGGTLLAPHDVHVSIKMEY